MKMRTGLEAFVVFDGTVTGPLLTKLHRTYSAPGVSSRIERIVLDTNILVSAFLNPSGAPSQVLTLTLAGELTSVAVHNAYHLGKIVALRQRIGALPPTAASDES